ncbi:MAG: hypothetical protein DYG94_09640 [Leptolyngbya sp. PLA3]|nr:MAG: hypothetical protein EDM82_08055 [Cyanobacteria bacterium CYA]MCE7968991.1 hypothetical protein [Leptolyngbya sp. PL-A3]
MTFPPHDNPTPIQSPRRKPGELASPQIEEIARHFDIGHPHREAAAIHQMSPTMTSRMTTATAAILCWVGRDSFPHALQSDQPHRQMVRTRTANPATTYGMKYNMVD